MDHKAIEVVGFIVIVHFIVQASVPTLSGILTELSKLAHHTLDNTTSLIEHSTKCVFSVSKSVLDVCEYLVLRVKLLRDIWKL